MNERPAPVEPVEAPTSDEEKRLLETARAAQIAGTFPSDSAIRLFTDGYGAGESERRHCMAAARLALAYWGHAWGCLSTNHPAPAEPADELIDYQDFTELCAKHSFHCDDDESVDQLFELIQEAIAADRAGRPAPAEPADHIRNATEMVTPPAEGEVIDLVGCVQEWAARLDEGTPEERLLGRVAYVLRQRQAPPHEGEIDALIKILSRIAGMLDFMPDGPPDGLVIHRAIELLRQLAPPAEGEVGELVDFLERLGSDHDDLYPPQESITLYRAADLIQQQAAELELLRRQAGPPAEGVAWQTAAALRRLSAQNPMGSADPTLLRAAELLERLAGQLAVLRQERPHA